MGVDLTLLPLSSRELWSSFDLWQVERRRELWPLIEELGEVPVPKPVTCYVARTAEGGTCFGDLSETPYGTPLAWLPAGKLASLDDPSIRDCWRNRAIWAALKELPEDWPVVLYWH